MRVKKTSQKKMGVKTNSQKNHFSPKIAFVRSILNRARLINNGSLHDPLLISNNIFE